MLVAVARLYHRKALLLRRAFPDLERSLILASTEMYGDDNRKHYNAGKHVWTFPDGQRIEFGHIKDLDAMRKDFSGPEYDLIGFDELTQFCHAPGTEVLTETGWRKLEEVAVGERVLALGQDWQARYEPVTATHGFDYSGSLLTTKNTRVHYAITPNHSMVIRSQRSSEWHFCEARNFTNYVDYPFSHYWLGTEQDVYRLSPIKGRGIGSNANVASELPMDDWLEFLGWYFSEGSSFLACKSRGGTSPCVSIRQTKPQPSLDALIARLPWRVLSDGDGGYKIFSRQLFDLLHPLGNSYTKRVPRYVFNLSCRQMKIFLGAFLAGDGYRGKSKGWLIGLANSGLRDDIQEICTLLGYRSMASHYVARGQYDVYTLYISHRHGGQVTDAPKNRTWQPYTGKVYCITVEPSHTFLARYDGRVFWSGNSKPMYQFMLSRIRTTAEGQRVRVISCTNPGDTGNDWVMERWAAWLDEGYPNPAKAGEVRWFKPGPDEREIETTADDPDGLSRTFIPATLDDNPYLPDEYRKQLNALPEPWRSQLLLGKWQAGLYDDPYQIVPTDWIRQAQARWQPDGRLGFLTNVGIDPARGGNDKTVLAPRYGTWIGQLTKMDGKLTPTGYSVVQLALPILARGGYGVIDVIGIGSAVIDAAKENKLTVDGVNVSSPTNLTDKSGKIRMVNLRAYLYWKLREALDPEGNVLLALPPDPELLGELRATKWESTTRGIKVIDKDDIRERLGRSPNCADAVMLTMREPQIVKGGVGRVF